MDYTINRLEIKLDKSVENLQMSISRLTDRVKSLENKIDEIFSLNRLQIQPIKSHEVTDKDNYNVCNLWEDEPPEDYHQKLEETWTRNWINLFYSNYSTYTIKDPDLRWIQEAFKVGTITGKFPSTYLEELDKTAEKMDKQYPLENKKCFVRAEATSLKGNIKYGPGPFQNWKEILEAMCTCRYTHNPFSKEVEKTRELKLYIRPWFENLDTRFEFRAFVFEKKLTALSPQNIYSVNPLLKDDIENCNAEKVRIIIKHLEERVIPTLRDHHTYTVDIALLSYPSSYVPYFIEINGFGAEYSAGSALFHWIRDKELLENGSKITVRYIIS